MTSKPSMTFGDYLSESLDVDFFWESNLDIKYRLDEVCIFCYVHCLPSLVILISALINIGIKPNNVFILPKVYSTITSAIRTLEAAGVNVITLGIDFRPGFYDEAADSYMSAGTETVVRMLAQRHRLRRLIVVDDGGLITATWWRLTKESPVVPEIVSVQQTASGFGRHRRGRSPYVKIDVARSAAKRFVESKIIVQGILAKVSALDGLLERTHRFAVVGLGAVGGALARMLRDHGKAVWAYDRATVPIIEGVEQVESWRQCVRCADVVFGCTGANWIGVDQLARPADDAVRFVSCSSRDVEFKNVLQHRRAPDQDDGPQFEPLRVSLPNDVSCHVDNWGFPINFDRKVEWEASKDIALTRGLVYAGILQGLAVGNIHSDQERIEPLPAIVQRSLVETWLDWQGRTPEEIGISRNDFEDLGWWSRHSISDET
jgi:hypothetical protein